jgi:hypothetical protein
MPRECPPAFRIESAPAELIQPSECPFDYPAPALQPTAMLGVAFRKKGDECVGHAGLAGLTPRHSHGRPLRCQDDGAVVPASPLQAWDSIQRACCESLRLAPVS